MTRAPVSAWPLSAIDATGVVAIIRGRFIDRIEQIVEALIEGGLQAIEISLTSPDALTQIERAAAAAGTRAAIGAGTVMRVHDVEDVARIGGVFIVSPVIDGDVIRAALDRGLLPIPGACTPTEVAAAIRAGAPAVKLFPADTMAPAFVRALRAPFPDVRLVPTGGVTLERAGEFARAGAWAVGVGSPLVSPDTEPDTLARTAAEFIAVMRAGTRR